MMFGTLAKDSPCANTNCLVGSPTQNADGSCGCNANTQIQLPNVRTNPVLLTGTGTIIDWVSLHPFIALGGAAAIIFLLLKMFKK